MYCRHAGSNENNCSPPDRCSDEQVNVFQGLNKMRKEELTQILQDLGEEVLPKWTREEVLSRIQELKPKETEESLPGLSGKSRDSLIEIARTKGLQVSESATRGSLMRAIAECMKNDKQNETQGKSW